MSKARISVGMLASCLLLWSNAATMAAAPSVAQMLSFRPRLEGIVCSTPTPQELESCKVELVTGSVKGSNGWMLRDARGLPVRRFYDSNGDKKVDVWSYYLDGLEVYREIDSNFNEKVDQYRWLNTAGTKWGIDSTEHGKIDSWKAISAEELSQEVLQAFISKDFARLQMLMISDAEIKGLDLSTAEAARLRLLQTKARTKFQATLAKFAGLSDKTHWVRLEAGIPQAIPADQIGARHDLTKYLRSTILYENNGKHDFLPMGEMILVGAAWRIIDAPGETEDEVAKPSPELQAVLDLLSKIDSSSPKDGDQAIAQYNLQRADVILKIMPLDLKDRTKWTRQLAECLAAAAQSSQDRVAYDRLMQLEQQVVKEQAASTLAAFVTYREMQADYAFKLSKVSGPDYLKVQSQWVERLAQFVQTYPKAEDGADALMQLGMVSEFINKEIEAKNWYNQLIKEFPKHAMVAKAKGAVRRLELEGKKLELADSKFDIARLQGKLVVVYYWASWNQQCIGDFPRLKVMLDTYGRKGLELVAVNLDNGPPEADSPVAKMQIPGTQLTQPGGLESPLATYYGIMSLPNLFLVGTDGKVLNRSVQVGNLEDEIKKYLK